MTKLAGLSARNPMMARLTNSRADELIELENVPVFAVFQPSSVDLVFLGPRHVPQLRVEGVLERLVPQDPSVMPYAISEISLDPSETTAVTVDYLFTNEQLESLVSKGLYIEGFGPPAEMSELAWEMSMSTSMSILPPTVEGEPPIVGVDLAPMRAFEMSLETSGYELADMFPDYRAGLLEAGAISVDDGLGIDTVSAAEFEDMYADSPLPAADLSGPVRAAQGARDPRAELERLSGERLEFPRAIKVLDRELGAKGGEDTAVRAGRRSLLSREEHAIEELYRSKLQGVGAQQVESPDEVAEALETELGDIDLDDLELDLDEGLELMPSDGEEDEAEAPVVDELDDDGEEYLSDDDELDAAKRTARREARRRAVREAAKAQQGASIDQVSSMVAGKHRVPDSAPEEKKGPQTGPEMG